METFELMKFSLVDGSAFVTFVIEIPNEKLAAF